MTNPASIKDVFIQKGHFNFANPEEIQVSVSFVTADDRFISCALPLESAEHLLDWNGDNPVDLLREVIEIDEKVYLYNSEREKLKALLEQCVPYEDDIETEWLKKKQAKLMEKIKNIAQEVRRIRKKLQCLQKSEEQEGEDAD